jgi:hypothetical protein
MPKCGQFNNEKEEMRRTTVFTNLKNDFSPMLKRARKSINQSLNVQPLLLVVLVVAGCTQLQSKSKEIARKTQQKFATKKDELVDKLHPHFDAYHPDTPFNRKRFHEFLKIPLTDDVHSIYCFADEMGIDADYQFAFKCSPATVQRLVKKLQLKPGSPYFDDISSLQTEFEWWKKKEIQPLDVYSHQVSPTYYRYFWYDVHKQKAYYFEFDM